MSRASWIRVTWWSAAATAALLVVILGQVLRTPVSANYLPTALTALAVFAVVIGVGACIQGIDIRLNRAFPWFVGSASLAFSLVPLWLLSAGNTEKAAAVYRGLRIPQGIERFWDAALVLRSIDCSAVGVDVFAEHNGCLQDPAIYGPGMLWLKFIPFNLVSFSHVIAIGVAMTVVSSLTLVWLARQSSGLGQMVLLIAAVGAPWLLLLERGNIDAVLIWVAALVVIIVFRYPSIWAWSLAAALIWLVGTWKYYPFAMGLMLIPVVLIRRGWIVLLAWCVASAGFVLLTWSNFKFSMQSNSNMTEIGDAWVLGRVPVVARMFGSNFPSTGVQLGDLLVGLMAFVAVIVGVLLAVKVVTPRQQLSLRYPMLGLSGSSLFLSSVSIGGFGWAYKAAFLLLCVPIIGWLASRGDRLAAMVGLMSLALIAICSVVVWNTLLASLAGIIAASVAFGISTGIVYLHLNRHLRGRIEKAPTTL